MGSKKGRPVAVIREELLQSPEAKAIAEKFGIPLEEYVEKVLEYVKDPKKEPVLNVLDEGEVRAAGGKVSTVGDIKAWVDKVLKGEIRLGGGREVKDGFEAAPKKKP